MAQVQLGQGCIGRFQLVAEIPRDPATFQACSPAAVTDTCLLFHTPLTRGTWKRPSRLSAFLGVELQQLI